MIVTKGIVKSIPKKGTDENAYTVSVPMFEDNTARETIFEAYLCTQPDFSNGINVDDVVYVTFEGQFYNTAIILGKLFVKVPDESDATGYGLLNELTVTNKVNLPWDTTIGGYSVADLFKFENAAENGNSLKYKKICDWEYVKDSWEDEWWKV